MKQMLVQCVVAVLGGGIAGALLTGSFAPRQEPATASHEVRVQGRSDAELAQLRAEVAALRGRVLAGEAVRSVPLDATEVEVGDPAQASEQALAEAREQFMQISEELDSHLAAAPDAATSKLRRGEVTELLRASGASSRLEAMDCSVEYCRARFVHGNRDDISRVREGFAKFTSFGHRGRGQILEVRDDGIVQAVYVSNPGHEEALDGSELL